MITLVLLVYIFEIYGVHDRAYVDDKGKYKSWKTCQTVKVLFESCILLYNG